MVRLFLITLIYLFGFLLSGCKFTNDRNGGEGIQLDTICSSIPVTDLPYFIGLPETGLSSHHNLQNYVEEIIQHTQVQSSGLDFLFCKGTIINYPYPFPYSNQPNQLPGTFFKRLVPKGDVEVFLFSYYHRAYLTDGMSKMPYIELQTFNSEGRLLDRMVIYGGLLGWVSWIRTFSIDENYIITLYNHFQQINEEGDEESTFEKKYQINPEGRILDYYVEPEGRIIETIEVNFFDESIRWYASGEVHNHLKQGEWIDYEHYAPDPMSSDSDSWQGRQVRINYVEGIPQGQPRPITPGELNAIVN